MAARAKPAGRSSRSGWGGELALKLTIFAALCILPLGGAAWLWLERALPWVLAAYLLVSLLAFALYWHDKRSAQQGVWRIPEKYLHAAELLGGWPGALLAQQLFRHKTRKVSYQLVFWGIVVLHQSFWGDWLLLDGHFIRQLLPETLAVF